MIIGVTGGIGCGKSTITRFFQELGCPVLSADEVVHEIYASDAEVREKLSMAFGTRIFSAKGDVNRAILAEVFSSKETTRTLNRIVHPAVIRRIQIYHQDLVDRDPSTILVVEAPLLFEAGVEEVFDRIICVTCPEEEGYERFAGAGNTTPEEARKRAGFQLPQEEKARRSDFVIDNSGDRSKARERVLSILNTLRSQLI
ncbi:MAG TPA: dephospho-CoA kinase [Thermoanaerobaculia bacterium]|nr:dephospho-CoA kinase [Thermoanaerobaculia bacterium]HUM29309.1 dephospho-CoA kinase [Thermoanaerobaculia bacterium]HXK67733.1 dephospho-CoA kinase [Thermoanaerobaculia bacterium]